jgi:hypothetical protein
MYYKLIYIFICTPIWTKKFILVKSGCYTLEKWVYPLLSISLMMKSAENQLQFAATLYFFNLAQIGPMTNADRR